MNTTSAGNQPTHHIIPETYAECEALIVRKQLEITYLEAAMQYMLDIAKLEAGHLTETGHDSQRHL